MQGCSWTGHRLHRQIHSAVAATHAFLIERIGTAWQSTVTIIVALTELHLQEPLVRDTAVTALLELYSDEDNVEPMHELTTRFAPRFAQLIHDIDEGVAVKGVSPFLMRAACVISQSTKKRTLKKIHTELSSVGRNYKVLCTMKRAKV